LEVAVLQVLLAVLFKSLQILGARHDDEGWPVRTEPLRCNGDVPSLRRLQVPRPVNQYRLDLGFFAQGRDDPLGELVHCRLAFRGCAHKPMHPLDQIGASTSWVRIRNKFGSHLRRVASEA